MKKGFTLVELAIVLVIIGLLVTGVLAGQALIKQAQIMRTIAEMDKVRTSVYTFKAKYEDIPGDARKATMFGIDKDELGVMNVSATANTNYNGNGDGVLQPRNGGNFFYFDGEIANFWVHLSNTKLIKGDFSQTFGCNGVAASQCKAKAGEGYPETPIGGGLLVLNSFDYTIPSASFLNPDIYFALGIADIDNAALGGNTVMNSQHEVFPEDASIIDTKLDDGAPRTGRIFGFQGIHCSGAVSPQNCTPPGFFSINGGVSGNDCYTAQNKYDISKKEKACKLAIKADF